MGRLKKNPCGFHYLLVESKHDANHRRKYLQIRRTLQSSRVTTKGFCPRAFIRPFRIKCLSVSSITPSLFKYEIINEQHCRVHSWFCWLSTDECASWGKIWKMRQVCRKMWR